MNQDPASSPQSHQYQQALQSLQATIEKLRGCNDAERTELAQDFSQLGEMYQKLTERRVEIVIFGEISTGKSALINALIGREVASVDVQGGWTREVWGTTWEGTGHRIRGMENSEIVLVDTPGINEVGGVGRAELAEVTARKADLILFVIDSDINEVEFASLVLLAAVDKPILLVFNKSDLYSESDREALLKRVALRVHGMIPPELIVTSSAHPRPVETVLMQADGSERIEWRRPEPDVGQLKKMILEVLDREGLGLIALNGALYAADKSDRIHSMRVRMRRTRADQVVWGMAATKACVVAINPLPGFDIAGGLAIDALTIATLSKVYGLDFSMYQARGMARTIAGSAGLLALGELTNWGASAFKAMTLTFGTPLTLIPQGAAAGFSGYIIGRAAQYYFEHGGSWGAGSPKEVVRGILAETDRNSVLTHLKTEIQRKLRGNRHGR